MDLLTRAISVVRHICDRVMASIVGDQISAGSRWLRIFWIVSWIVVGLHYLGTARRFARIILRQWPRASGYEYEWIANALASGHGYAFDPEHAWLGPYARGSEYTLSAWIDPVQTFIMAASFQLFGEHGRLVLVLLNVLWVAATALVVALCCRRVSTLNIALFTAALFILGQLYVSIPWY